MPGLVGIATRKGIVALNEESILTDQEKSILLEIARESIQAATNMEDLPELHLTDYSEALRQEGASFVTLTIGKRLRGCIGTLEAYQPLVFDVQEHAVAAATQDYRFSPVKPEEIPMLTIEVSHLTPTRPLEYEDWQDLISMLRPGVDGVLIKDKIRRATFLPQVWEKVPDPSDFLTHLCYKMGAPGDLWKRNKLQVFTYQVEEFKEA